MQENEITYVALPKQDLKEQFLIAHSKIFGEEDTKDLVNQKVKVVNQTKLVGSFDKPIPIVKTFNLQS